MKNPVNSVELALLHSLKWEQHDFKVSDPKQQWDLNEAESAAVIKWMKNRIQDIESRIE